MLWRNEWTHDLQLQILNYDLMTNIHSAFESFFISILKTTFGENQFLIVTHQKKNSDHVEFDTSTSDHSQKIGPKTK